MSDINVLEPTRQHELRETESGADDLVMPERFEKFIWDDDPTVREDFFELITQFISDQSMREPFAVELQCLVSELEEQEAPRGKIISAVIEEMREIVLPEAA